jgi:hypothetical protein
MAGQNHGGLLFFMILSGHDSVLSFFHSPDKHSFDVLLAGGFSESGGPKILLALHDFTILQDSRVRSERRVEKREPLLSPLPPVQNQSAY